MHVVVLVFRLQRRVGGYQTHTGGIHSSGRACFEPGQIEGLGMAQWFGRVMRQFGDLRVRWKHTKRENTSYKETIHKANSNANEENKRKKETKKKKGKKEKKEKETKQRKH
jgi:hypothetical protein